MASTQIGIDIEDVRRFGPLVRNKRFLSRVFTVEEVRYCAGKKNRLEHFAARFAAKEAVWKAVSAALRRSRRTLSHRDIGVRNDRDGRPAVVLPAALSRLARRISISLSHTRTHVVAVAVLCS